MKMSSRRKFWLLTLLVAVLLAFALGAGIAGVEYVRRAWWELAASRAEIERLAGEREAVTAAGRALVELSEDEALIRASFATPADALPFIESIEGLGRRSGVRAELSIAGGKGDPEEYSLAATGPFRSVFMFFKHLESLPFLTQLSNAELQRSESMRSDSTEPTVRFTVTVRIVTPGEKP
ncbi:MAG: hypothetical protein HY473_02240 [Candidatus Sungbacteria bacterium]|uniref:Uncharacterized protein n=1 Tax=Candidatus Sungiibacteriota bacterium TaxID=2750080 RepID=A0A933DS67_9BACT|nr:hypothetical protein [Candidatus Sungbacteria bacterium]